ncbi:MAG: DUF1365 domain-containing protein [Acidimicrobiales bacterium]
MCAGVVLHRRHRPTHHEFRRTVHYVWFDPDRPDELCRHHATWSTARWRPVQLRTDSIDGDYGDGSAMPLGDQARDRLAEALGRRPAGPVRLLTQPRRWGWLFNPISVFVVWDDADADPIGAVLEVTNTPWKERHHYAVALQADPGGGFRARFDKALHVSPFLDEDHRYDLWLDGDDDRLALRLDVVQRDVSSGAAPPTPIVETELRTERRRATAETLAHDLFAAFVPTHRVSIGIHVEAARLAWKRVPFVPHPRRRSTAPAGAHSDPAAPDPTATTDRSALTSGSSR